MPPPISKLHNDILWMIFDLNTSYAGWNSTPLYLQPINLTRQASQVCRRWREILLDSPSIWGRCIQLSMLDQKGNHWRDLVLSRSGKSLLYVEGRSGFSPESNVANFFLNMLDKHWNRISYFDVSISYSLLNNARMWDVLCRPSPSLKVFWLYSEPECGSRLEAVNPPTRFRLFGDYAPFLTELTLSKEFDFLFTTNTFAHNLTKLRLRKKSTFRQNELLQACAQMLHLEDLDINISRIVYSSQHDNKTLVRPSMPSLKKLEINTNTLDVYPAFLDHIESLPGCKLSVYHSLKEWDSLDQSKKIQDVADMWRVIKSYVASYQKDENRWNEFSALSIDTIDHDSQFRFGPFFVGVDFGREIPTPFLHWIIGLISTFTFPVPVTRLLLNLSCSDVDEMGRCPFMLQMLKSMCSITSLITTPYTLTYINAIEEYDGMFPSTSRPHLFPALKNLNLTEMMLEFGDDEHIMAFLEHRRYMYMFGSVIPLEVLDMSEPQTWPLGDFRCWDKLHSDLKVIWCPEEPHQICEYICGSGNENILLLNDARIREMPDT